MRVTHRARILIVEDEEHVALMLQSRLEAAGYAVQTAACGKAALGCAAAHPPELVILDLRLPDIHGYQVCRQLRKLYRPWSVPVLMLTAMDQPIDQLRGFGHGTDSYLTKPFDPNELLRTVELLLSHPTPSPDASIVD